MRRARPPSFVRAVHARRRSAAKPLRRLALVLASFFLSAVTVVPWVVPESEALPPSSAGSGTAVWHRAGNTSPRYRTWNGASFDAVASSAAVGEFRVMQGAAALTRAETIVVGIKTSGAISGEMWNGSAWAALPFNDLATVAESFWWSVDVAYEAVSGDAVLVWANGTTGSAPLSYRVWNGSSWSAPAAITVPLSGGAKQMQLVAAPRSDEMVLVVSNEFSRDYALVWNGSAWGSPATLDSSGNNDDRTDIAAAYQQQSGMAVVAFGRDAATPFFRSWNGSAWSAEFTIPTPPGVTGNARWLALASDPGSNSLALGVLTFNNEVWLELFDGAAWGSGVLATSAAAGEIFPGMAVAFEDVSGDVLATYAEANNRFRYRTWTAAAGWSARADGPDLGAQPNSMTLDARRDSGEVMLAVQDANSDLHYTLWSGTGWGAQTEVDTDTGEVKNQPFLFLWDHPGNRPPAFGEEPTDRSDAEGTAVSFSLAAADPDGHALTYSATGLPGGVSIDAATGTISGTVAYTAAIWSPYAVQVAVTDGVFGDTLTFNWSVAPAEGMLFATRDAVDASGIPYLPSWGRAEVLSFGNPGLSWYPPTTAGTFASVLDFEAFGSADLDGLEVVNRPITIGGRITLQPGDFLFSLAGDTTLVSDNTVAVHKADVVRFRPAGGDLSHGTFEIVLDNPLGADIWGVALAEIATTVAPGVTIPAGGFVLLRTGGAEDNDLWLYVPTSAGDGTTAGTTSLLVEGDDLGMNEKVWGVDLVEEFGGGAFRAGSFFLCLEKEDVVAGTAVAKGDVFRLALTSTSLGGGTAAGSAAIVFRGSTVGLETDKERPTALVLRASNRPPAFDQDLGDRTSAEGDTIALSAGAHDPDGDDLLFSATGLPAGLSIDSATGQIAGILGYTASAGSPYTVMVRVEDPGGLFDTDTFTWTVTDTSIPLAITKTSSAGGVATPGQRIDYEIVVEVPGSTHQTGIAVNDPLPAGTTFMPGSLVVEAPAVARDHFATVGSYAGQDGALPWSGSWVEMDGFPPDVGPDQVVADATWCPDSPCFRLGGTSTDLTDQGIYRNVDLSGRTSATLEFSTRRRLLGATGGTVAVRVRRGINPWTTLVTLNLNGSDAGPVSHSFDISAYIGSSTGVQIIGSGFTDSYLYLDDVAITADGVVTETGGSLPNAASGYHLEPGESLSVRFAVMVNDPAAVTEIVNAATARSTEEPGGRTATTRDRVNLPPAFDQDLRDRSDPEAAVVLLPAPATDPNGDPLTYSASGLPLGLSIDPSIGLITGTISYYAAGLSPYAVVVEVRDSSGATDTDTFTWTVIDTNRSPEVANPGPQSGTEGEPALLALEGSDPDSDPLTWSATGLPPGLAIGPATGVISGTISYDAAAGSPYAVTVRVEDPGGLFDTDTFTWTVAPTSRPPAFDGDLPDRTDAEGTVATLSAPAADPDGDPLAWSATGLPPGLAIGPATGVITGTISYDAAAGSPYAVTVRVEDPGGLFDTDTFSWTVTNTNRAPAFDDPLLDRADGEGSSVLLPTPASDPDGDALAWSATGLPPGLAIDPAAGTISGTITAGASAGSPYAVTVRVEDPGGLFATASFTWTIGPAELAVTKSSDAPGRIVPGQLITYTITVTNQGTATHHGVTIEDPVPAGTSYVGGSGEPPPVLVSGATLLGDGSLTVTLQVRADDPLGESQITNSVSVTSARQVIPVTAAVTDPTNRPPAIASLGDQASAEGEVVTLPLSASDPDGDALAWSATGLPPGLGIDGATGVVSGTISYDASAGSPYTVVVRVEDVGGLVDTATFTWLVGSTNRPPTFDGDLVDRSDAEGQMVSLAAPATDLDGDTLTWSATGLPPGLSIDPATGIVSGTIGFDAAPGSPYAVLLRVRDSGGLQDTDAFTWTVTATNRAPSPPEPMADQSSAEGDVVSVALTADDPDGDTLTWSAAGLPPGISINPTGGVISGTVSFEASPASPYLVVVRVEDPGGLSAFDSFSWTVADTNRAPAVVDPGPQGSGEGQAAALTILGTDPDGDTLTWSATGLPPGLAIDPATGTISGTVPFDAAPGSPYTVTVRATDDGAPALSTTATFSWTVADTNRGPLVVGPADRSDAEGQSVSLSLSGSDPDGDTLTWSASGLPPGLTIDPATGVISGTLSYEGAAASPYGVAVAATDDGVPALSSGASFLWAVADVNRAPHVLHPGDRWAAEGDPVTVAPAASDPDGDTLTWSAAGLPPGLAIDPASGVVSGTLSFEASAGSPHAVTLSVTDDRIPNLTGSVTFNLTVADTNRPPLVTDPGSQADAEGESVLLALSGADPDGDTVTWAAVGLPPGLVMDPATGMISGTLSFEASAGSPHTVAVTATDDGAPSLSAGVAFLWTVADTNRPPQILDPGDPVSAEGAAVTLALTGWDPDGDSISWSAAGLPPGLSMNPATGTVTGTLGYDTAGTHPVTVTATDDGVPALSTQISFAWQVTGTNRAPEVADPGPQSSAEGEAISLLMAGFDPDGDHLAWSAAGLPPGLAIDPATGEISGTLGFTTAGAYEVMVTARDDGSPSLSGLASFSWVVADTNRAPVVVVPADRTDPEGAAVALPVVGSDPDGDGLTWSAVGLPPGLAIDPATGVISGMLDFGVAAGSPYRVTVAASDDGSPVLAAGGSFTWSIGDVDRAPVLDSLPDRTGEVGDAVSLTLTATDPDGDPLTWSASGLPPGVSLDASGHLGGSLGGAGAFTVTVTVRAGGGVDSGSFTWVVTGPGAPEIEPVGNQSGTVGEDASLAVVASSPDGGPLTYFASGLPPGLVIDRATGVISGTPAAAGVFPVTLRVFDPAGASASATFLWIVEDLTDLPPEAQDDAVVVSREELGDDGVVVVAVLGNDSDPEGEPLTLVAVEAPAEGTASAVEGTVVFGPPAGWVGTVAFAYRVADPAGQEDSATVTITIQEGLDDVLAASALQWRPPGGSGVAVPALGSSGTLLNTLVQSLHVLRVPLALLGGAVIWSLLLGGALNVGLAVRRGLPAAFARRGRLMAIVMAAQGAKVPAFRSAGGGEVVHQYLATDSRIKSTGRRAQAAGRQWLEVLTDEGRAWVESVNLTEHLDRAFFAEDRAPWHLLERFVDALRRRDPLTGLVSCHGLWVAHHGTPLHYPPDRVGRLWDDAEMRTWKGRNPAYPDLQGTFDTAVAAGVLDAYDHPRMELTPDQPAVPSTVIPVEFTNLHFISIGADLIGPERLDQTAWLVHFSYEDGKPRIIGLCREG